MGVQALRANRLRTALSTLGVVIGVASLVAVLSLGDGMERFVREQIAGTTDLQTLVVRAHTTQTVDGQLVPREDYPVFTPADAAELTAAVPEVASVGMLLTDPGRLRLPGSDSLRAARVGGVTANAPEVFGIEVVEGRFFTAGEERAGDRVVVVTPALARELARGGPPRAALGRPLQLGGEVWRVVGVAAPSDGDDETLGAMVPVTLAERAMVARSRVRPPTMYLKIASVEQVPAARRGVERWLTTRYGDWEGRVAVVSNEMRVRQARQGIVLFKLFMGAIAAISLLVGGIGIMNVLLASVAERTREIGVRKAVGARQRDLLLQFLSEAVAVTGLGSLLGVILGLVGALAVTAGMRAATEAPVYAAISWSTLAVAAVAAVVVGVSFGLYPALRAARLSPIDAIRHE